MKHATTRMNLEDIILSEISQMRRKGQILYDFNYLRYLEESNSYKQKTERQLLGAGVRGVGQGRGLDG